MRQLLLILACASNASAAVDAGFDGDDGIYAPRKLSLDELEAPRPPVRLSFDVDQHGDDPAGALLGGWPAILRLSASLDSSAKQATLLASDLQLRLTDKTGAPIDWRIRPVPQSPTRIALDRAHSTDHLEWVLEEAPPTLKAGRYWVTARWGKIEMAPKPMRVVLPATPLTGEDERRLRGLRIRVARALHEVERARVLAREALAMTPDDPEAFVQVAETALDAGDLAAARKAADEGERIETSRLRAKSTEQGNALEATDPSPLWHHLKSRIREAELKSGKVQIPKR